MQRFIIAVNKSLCPSTGKLYNLLQDYCELNLCHPREKNVFKYIREKINSSNL